MDDMFSLANELKEEIQNTPEVKEYLRLKKIVETDESLNELRTNIAKLKSQNKLEEANNLLEIYNNNPLVWNYNVAKEDVTNLLIQIKNILNN